MEADLDEQIPMGEAQSTLPAKRLKKKKGKKKKYKMKVDAAQEAIFAEESAKVVEG